MVDSRIIADRTLQKILLDRVGIFLRINVVIKRVIKHMQLRGNMDGNGYVRLCRYTRTIRQRHTGAFNRFLSA